ncbi:MAG: MYXO-CTERM sorting domain-containing protein [Polyangiaceae bacterium]
MLQRSSIAAVLFASFAFLAGPSVASADAIMPPPEDCPSGQVGTSDHGGPRCVLAAPEDCPTGWQGAMGGQCILHPCVDDTNCNTGEACVEHAVCLKAVEDPFYDYGEEEREKHGALEPPASDLLKSPGLLAGPPMPKTRREKPIYRYEAVNLCAPEVACLSPNTCQPEKLCVPRGSRALAYRGTNIGPVRVARKTETPLTTNGVEPKEVPAVVTSKSGCAGCAAASSEGAAGWALFAALGALVMAVRRRERARERARRGE